MQSVAAWAEFTFFSGVIRTRNNCNNNKICINEKVRRAVDEKLMINELWPYHLLLKNLIRRVNLL